jgi:hypothetical protein
MGRIAQIIALAALLSVGVFAQTTDDIKSIDQIYDEISRLDNQTARKEFLARQTIETRTELWHENIRRKTATLELSAEQKEIIATVQQKFITVEFAKSVVGKSEADAGDEYKEIMGKANKLLGNNLMRDLFGLMGDSKTLKKK